MTLLLTSPALAKETSHFNSCEAANISLVREDHLTGAENEIALPNKVGNFGSVQEGLAYFKGDAREFLSLLSSRISTLSEAQKDYALALQACALGRCEDPQMQEALEKDLASLSENWHSMRLGLAIGFTSFDCMSACDSFEPVVKHLFQWAKPFASPSELGSRPYYPSRTEAGALTLEEGSEANEILRKITAPILDRPQSFWELLAGAANPGSYAASPDGMRATMAAVALSKPGPNGEPSLRDYWKQQYFDSIQKAPLLLFVSKPNPSREELAAAYGQIAKNAKELRDGLHSNHRMRAWEYFSLTARDILATYHGVTESILQENPKYCGIAERMLREKLSNDQTKTAVAIGSTIVTGVGCVLTGSSYVGLSLCALSSIGLTAKSNLDAQAEADAARVRAASSATPSLLVDEFQSLSDADQAAVMNDALRYLSLIDVAILGGSTLKLTGKALTFVQRLETFSREISRVERVDPKLVRAALKNILRDSPSFIHAKRGAQILAHLPAGSLTKSNAGEIGRACKALAPMINDAEISLWAKKLSLAIQNGDDSVKGFSLVSEKAVSLFYAEKMDVTASFRKALDLEVSQWNVEGGRLISSQERNLLRNDLVSCLEKTVSCGDGFGKLGRSLDDSAKELNRAGLADAVRKTVAREASEKELKALEEARKLGSLDAYTAEEVVQQDKMLKKAGFSLDEIKVFRKEGLLGNWVRDSLSSAPTSTKVIESVRALDRPAVEQIKSGKNITYLVDDLGQLHLTDEIVDLGGETALLLRVKDEAGAEVIVRVREAGQIARNGRSIEFQPTYGNFFGESSAQEIQAAMGKVDSAPVSVKLNPKLQQAHMLKCVDILQGRQRGKGFVLNSLIGDNVVMTGAILSGELTGANRLGTKDGREIVMTDYEASNVSWLLNGYLRKGLTLKNTSFLGYASTRLPSNFLLIELQREIFRNNLTSNADTRSSNIRNYNAGWMFAKLPASYYFDRYLVNTLPMQLFNACSSGGKAMQIVFHPGVVALYEKTFSAIMYYQGRKAIVGE